MRVVITGAGSVGRSVARELLANGHHVLLVDKEPRAVQTARVADAEWLLADACEISALNEAGLESCDVVVAATRAGVPVPAFGSSLSYFDALRRERLPAALIQALRDDFGAHTYERVDRDGTFHTRWADPDRPEVEA